MKIQRNKYMASTLVDCSSSKERDEAQKLRWFKYQEPLRYFKNCGLVDLSKIELIKIGTNEMTIGDVFTALKNQTEYTPLNHCMSDFISQNPNDERVLPLLTKCTNSHYLFFFGSVFQNYTGQDSWVLAISHNSQGSPICYQKQHLHERWYPDYWNIAVIKNEQS
jgi:hypothetical protein